jgi:ketosteroid isomerase-like protein
MGEAREVMDRVTEAVVNRDNEALKACYAPDAVVETPDQGTLNGNDAVAEYMNEFSAGFSDLGWEEIQKHEVGSVAIDEGYFLGKHTNAITGPNGEAIEPTGKEIRVRECDIATVEGGVITSHRIYFDNLDFMAQLGLTEASATS